MLNRNRITQRRWLRTVALLCLSSCACLSGCASPYHDYTGCRIPYRYCPPRPLPYRMYQGCHCPTPVAARYGELPGQQLDQPSGLISCDPSNDEIPIGTEW